MSSPSQSIATSGETTPTAVMTPQASTTTEICLPDFDAFTTCGCKEPETEEEIIERIRELIAKLPREFNTDFISQIHQKWAESHQPCIGSLTYADNVGMSSKRNVRYATSNRLGRPSIAVALKGFSTANRRNQILFVSAANQRDTLFDMQLNSWDSTSMKNIRVDWLELLDGHTQDGLWQHGEWSSGAGLFGPCNYVNTELKPRNEVNAEIRFAKPYNETPKVVVFLSGIHTDHTRVLRVHFWAENVTTTSFSLKGGTYDDTKLYNLKITWIAYASSLRGIHSGTVSTDSFRTRELAQHMNMGYEAFPPGTFTKPPKVMVGFNHLDLANTEQNIEGFVSNVNQMGMCWNTDSWGETINYRAGLSYLAIEEMD